MPAIFAHDLFGRMVFRELDPEIQMLIREKRDCFYLGVQGPDILFFYRPWKKNPINQKGYRYHRRPAVEIAAHGLEVIRKEPDECKKRALQAYLLGIACHFALDDRLHGTVSSLEDLYGFTHAELETELDRRLLLRETTDPVRAYTACHLKNTTETRFAAMKILKEEESQIQESILTFHWITRLFINTGEWFKQFIGIVMKMIGCYDLHYGMVMKKKMKKTIYMPTDCLETEFDRSVSFGRQMVEGLYSSMKKKDPIPGAFWRDFEGQKG